jgi:hypothetical protein
MNNIMTPVLKKVSKTCETPFKTSPHNQTSKYSALGVVTMDMWVVTQCTHADGFKPCITETAESTYKTTQLHS